MFIDDSTSTRHGKTYRRVLLRNSYRINGKVRHDTLANLSQCLLERVDVTLPDAIPHRNISVVTRKQLVSERKVS
jgi:hypothetical protein